LTGTYKRSISHFLYSPASTEVRPLLLNHTRLQVYNLTTSTVVLAGSNGEAVTLSTAEKTSLVQLTRKLAARLNRPDVTITLGCGGQSTHHVIDDTVAAHQAGADFAMVLVPSYYHFAMDSAAIVSFFEEVADHSPIPVMVYNYPGVAAGLDVDSDILVKLSAHPNISGAKLTCGGIGKVPRVTANAASPFSVLGGQIDWMGPAMAVGAVGAITGMANLYPRVSILSPNLFPSTNNEPWRRRVLSCTISTRLVRPRKQPSSS
jgi:dihydrodipicolinate synthase/N-acetylneuraminate lyase